MLVLPREMMDLKYCHCQGCAPRNGIPFIFPKRNMIQLITFNNYTLKLLMNMYLFSKRIFWVVFRDAGTSVEVRKQQTNKIQMQTSREISDQQKVDAVVILPIKFNARSISTNTFHPVFI